MSKPYVLRDSGSARGLQSYWGKWLGCGRAAILKERAHRAKGLNILMGAEEEGYAEPAAKPKLKKNGEEADDAAGIGILGHAQLEEWCAGRVAKPSRTVFAEHPRVKPRTQFVAGMVTDHFAERIGNPRLLGTPVGSEYYLSATADVWGEQGGEADTLLTPEEFETPWTGIIDYVTELSEREASTLRILTLDDSIRAGLTVWDWKIMAYHSYAPRHVRGYQCQSYSLLLKEKLGRYPDNFIFVCLERGTGIVPKLSNPMFVRKPTPDAELDRMVVLDYILQAARARAANAHGVRLDLCGGEWGTPCQYGPEGNGLCNQRPEGAVEESNGTED